MKRAESPVVVVSDTLRGGAAAATNRLVDGLALAGVGSERWHFTAESRTTAAAEQSLDPCAKRPAFERALKNVSRVLADRLRHRRHEASFLARVASVRPRVLNIHNIHACGLNHDSLLGLPEALPLVWTLHDCWPFRPEAFEWMDSAAGRMESTAVDRPLAAAQDRRKRFLARRADVVWVAPSRWMESELRRHVPGALEVHHIPYGVDSGLFRPEPQAEAAAALGLDPGRTWIGYSSTWVSSRKGTDILPAALQSLDCARLGLLAWGEPPAFRWPDRLEVRTIGHAEGPSALSRLYSACDLFVCPSRADNLPNAVLESLACGTPVVGSSAGGIPDMVRPGFTGWLFAGDDPRSFAASIDQALRERGAWPRLRVECRRAAVEDYALELQAARYARLFEKLGTGWT